MHGIAELNVSADLFLAALCHLAAELFKCRLVRRPSSAASTLRGGRANLRNASVTFSLFWHEASFG